MGGEGEMGWGGGRNGWQGDGEWDGEERGMGQGGEGRIGWGGEGDRGSTAGEDPGFQKRGAC